MPIHSAGRHPLYNRWEEDERRQRASFLATRRHLAPFLVPHRFEGVDKKPETLQRARYGYGVKLNATWLSDIGGHIRSAELEKDWGPVPKSALEAVQEDATGTGLSWDSFYGQTVLEWILSSPGGVIVADLPDIEAETQADAKTKERRPFLTWVPMSAVLDCGRQRGGFRWINIREEVDMRTPDGTTEKHEVHTLQYRLEGDLAVAQRFDANGDEVGELVNFEKLVNTAGRPTLPIIEANYGEHPEVPWLGSGLLLGLDDVVIDIYNILTEVREAFRDAAFGLLAYTGDDYQTVQQMITAGSRLVHLGEGENVKLERIAADGGEVAVGLSMLENAIAAWTQGARGKVQDAMAPTDAQSGVSRKTEFQLDLRPLLELVAGQMDEIETNTMFIVAQLLGTKAPTAAGKIKAERETTFQLENEESRIARIVKEFVETGLKLPGAAIGPLVMKWLEATNLLDLDQPVEDAQGQTRKLGEVLAEQVQAIGAARQDDAEVGERSVEALF